MLARRGHAPRGFAEARDEKSREVANPKKRAHLFKLGLDGRKRIDRRKGGGKDFPGKSCVICHRHSDRQRRGLF
jgi:hypothetical protein